MKVIYIDDDEDLIEVFKENIETATIEIYTFSSPSQVLAQYEEIQPDCIITDFRMPNMTGVEMARKLPKSLPKIMLTADFEVKSDDLFLKVFHKPVDYAEIQSYLEKFQEQGKLC